MDIWVLDKKYQNLGIIDTYESLIWAVRFNKVGEFELVFPYQKDIFDILQIGNYLTISESDRYMMIDKITIDTDMTDGSVKCKVEGRSLESVLHLRVVWKYTSISGSVQTSIHRLINENFISPSSSARKVTGLKLITSSDERITKKTFQTELLGEYIDEEIEEICDHEDVGFRVLPDPSVEGGYTFELYMGQDRTYEQNDRPYVVFSPDFDNLLSSNYYKTNISHRTAALVGGQGEGAEKVLTEVVLDSNATGWDRREVFLNPSDVTSTDTEGEPLPDATYKANLQAKAQSELKTYKAVEMFEGEINATVQFRYPDDFDIGDIVQVKNEFGMEAVARVDEIVVSYDLEGRVITPTFVTIKKEE